MAIRNPYGKFTIPRNSATRLNSLLQVLRGQYGRRHHPKELDPAKSLLLNSKQSNVPLLGWVSSPLGGGEEHVISQESCKRLVDRVTKLRTAQGDSTHEEETSPRKTVPDESIRKRISKTVLLSSNFRFA